MSHSGRIATLAADEHGAVLVIFAAFAPVAVLLAVFAIEASNWFLHDRHLQVQADAGVLAAAQQFQNCFTNATKANEEIKATAEQYSGVGGSEPVYNKQVAGSKNVHGVINSQTYYKAPSNPAPKDPSAVDKPPCEASMIDLKMTESDLPWYWHPLSSVGYLNAHARVEILQEENATGLEPLPVAETGPVAARAYFVDEDNKNAILAQAPLKKVEVNGQGQEVWNGHPEGESESVTIDRPHIGVVIALSGNKNDTTCAHEYVDCFGRKVANEKATLEKAEPALHIAGYPASGTGTPAKPIVREQALTPNTCLDGYFWHFSPAEESCKFNISAIVDYGSAKTQGMTVTPQVKGVAGAALTPPSTNGQTEPWKGSLTLPAGTGSNEITLKVACKAEVLSPCPAKSTEATVKNVHRIFAAGKVHSGSIVGASLSLTGGTPPANTFPECPTCKQKLVVTVDVEGSLAAASGFTDPIRKLKFTSNKSVWVCTPAENPSTSQYEDRIINGCPYKYKLNKEASGAFESCASAEPFNCVKNVSGNHNGARDGVSKRFISKRPAGTTFYCPSRWIDNNNGGVPIIPSDDSRIVHVFIVPYGSIGPEGEATRADGFAPIQAFAAFYVAGFSGDEEKCIQQGDPKTTSDFEIWGHFIKYINLVANEGGGKPKCQENPLGECVAVLTR